MSSISSESNGTARNDALADEYAPLRQLAHHFLGEKRVPGGPLGDGRGQLAE